MDKAYTVLDANEVRDKLRDLNVEGRTEVDLTEIPHEFMDWFWFSQGRNFLRNFIYTALNCKIRYN
jgi:hypothetical protein